LKEPRAIVSTFSKCGIVREEEPQQSSYILTHTQFMVTFSSR